ncbi:YwqJ-related putative deaminase [Pseudoalteromonas sp. MMG012]|uniref:YwqJ-related putative deaminase n=1 Tax=Pseudoalteromonas sp. MMG012 TaxID=2822686 RepID=UPI001B3A2FCA|nr:YwqJ-related putative deaminase [Pseudoalteromonas sp. MMG012]MBQ4852373.1 hypothetical protein [Pseudoalteromonas sp. MMG012]
MYVRLFLVAFFYLMSSVAFAAGGEGACALPNAGEEIAEQGITGNTELDEDETFKKAVSLEGQYWSIRRSRTDLARLSGKRTQNAAAYARAKMSVNDELLQTDGSININVKYAQVKNESWITTVSSEAPGETRYRINNIQKYMEKVEAEYASVDNKLNDITRKYIAEYLQANEAGGSDLLLNELSGLPGMHAEVQAFNRIVYLAEKEGVTLTEQELKKITIATVRVSKDPVKTGADFVACPNCSGILNGAGVNIITDNLPN